MTYDVIYADPPWQYNFSKVTNDSIEAHYPTMELKDICSLNIPSSKNSVLYLWATAPKLPDALKVMEAWGYTYKSCSIWDKIRPAIGYWWLGRHELLLVGTKGKFSPPKSHQRVGSVFTEKRGRHSHKPDQIRDYITSWTTGLNRLELFAREKHIGWHSWGNEVDKDVSL